MPDNAIAIFGTPQPAPQPKAVAVGSLAFLIDPEGIADLRFDGVEVVRRIAHPVRNKDWGTFGVTTISTRTEKVEAKATHSHVFSIGGDVLQGALHIEATGSALAAEIVLHLELTANQDVIVNRAGFVVLHPLNGVAGEALDVTHGDGRSEQIRWPDVIKAAQPVFDIKRLAHVVEGVAVDITFAGEIFEMEDQRNWSDASYKTYCRPLAWPRPFGVKAGETIRQSITVRLAIAGEKNRPAAVRSNDDAPFPDVMLAVDCEQLPSLSDHPSLADVPVVLRCRPDLDPGNLAELKGRDVALEIVLPDDAHPDAALAKVAAACRAAGMTPNHVAALPASYLDSHQPEGPWPQGPAPRDMIAPARKAFPSARIGTGVFSNFTELNRCPPDAEAADFVTFSTTALVHAADDVSVMQTVEALAHIRHSAGWLAGGKPLRLGLVSIGMRSNPYGSAVAPNPDRIRMAMAMDDPRQRGLFGAAFAVGALAALSGDKVASLCLAMAAGPLGFAPGGQPGTVHPLFHVIRAAHALRGIRARRITGALCGLVTFDGRGLVANLGPKPEMLADALPEGLAMQGMRLLSAASFAESSSPRWLDQAASDGAVGTVLPPFATAFFGDFT